MYLVINVIEGKLGVIWQEETWIEAVDRAFGMVQEQIALEILYVNLISVALAMKVCM